jgi:sugar lactone lactonase YvrE
LRRLAIACTLAVVCATLIFAQHPPLDGAGQAPTLIAEGVGARAIALDTHALVYLTATNAPNRLYALAATGPMGSLATAGKLEKVAGAGEAGSLGDGGSALDAQLSLKTDSLAMRSGIAIAPDGTIYIADTHNSTIRRVAGTTSTEPGIIRSVAGRWAPPQNVLLVEPMGIALDRAGDLFIADHSTNTVNVMHEAASSPVEDLETLAQVVSPASLAVTSDGGRVFVASPETGAVYSINTSDRSIQVVAGFSPRAAAASDDAASHVNSCVSQSVSAPEACPTGLAVDAGDNLFIADANANEIIRVDAKTEKAAIVAKGLDAPGEMAFDASGNLYVADQGRNRIVRYDGMGQAANNLTITAPGDVTLYDFGAQATGGATETAAFTLTNNSTSEVTGLVFNTFTGANPSDFTVASSSCTVSLAAGASCFINVAFTPQATGLRTAALSVTDSNHLDTPTSNVQGTGDDFQIQPAGSQLLTVAVIQGNSATFNLQIASDPNDNLALFSSTVTPTCPPYSTLPKYTTCTISPATATPKAGGTAAFAVTFKTTYNAPPPGTTPGMTPSVPRDTPQGQMRMPGLIDLRTIAAILAVGVLLLWRRRTAESPAAVTLRRAVPVMAVFIMGVTLVAGCKNKPNPNYVSTPTGSTNMILQATGQNTARTIQITLTVNPPPS